MKFIMINAVQESDKPEHDCHGIELIRIVDVKKVYADMSCVDRIYIEYYNNKTEEIRVLIEKFKSKWHRDIRLDELLVSLNYENRR